MRLRYRHRRWIALIALLGMFFQQFAMAAYICPAGQSQDAISASISTAPPCHQAATTDKSRCQQHCHPLAQSTDHASVPPLPLALAAPTTWLRHVAAMPNASRIDANAIDARSTAPPLTIQHCTFQI